MRFLLTAIIAIFLPAIHGSAAGQDLDITDIVAAQDKYIDAPTPEHRAALLQSLRDYTGEPTVETVRAHHMILSNDTQVGDYKAMYESATAARAHYEPVADLIEQQYGEARFVAAVALFNTELDPDAILDMAHVQGFATTQRAQDGERPDWAEDLMFKSDAWVMAMDAYFDSARKQHAREQDIEDILRTYGADDATINARGAAEDEDESGLPFCAGKMEQKPKLRYPRRKFLKGMFGAVILGLEFDDTGQVINPVVLASVPLDEFDERSLQTVGRWRYKPDSPDQVGVTCRLNRTNVVQPLVFQFR